MQASIEVFGGDLCDRSRTRQAVEACDVVFHLAALVAVPYSYQAVQSYLQSNVLGTFHVLEACREVGVERLVQTSSCEVYGTPRYTPIDERHPLQALNPYAATKISADQLAGSYATAFGLPVVTLRPFNNYGPRQSARAVIPTVISQALESDEIELGATRAVRDFLFVTDTVRGFLAAGETPDAAGQVFNLGTGHGVSIRQIVELVGRQLGRTLCVRTAKLRERPQRTEVQSLVCSAEHAALHLGRRPQVALEDGLAQTIRWIEDHRDRYRPLQYAL